MPRPAFAPISAKAPGQLRAAQTNAATIRSPASASEGSGVQGAATTWPPSATGPGKIRSPSPGDLAGPQTKHRGNACAVNPTYLPAASAAAPEETGSGGEMSS